MADEKDQQREADSPPHADPKGVNPDGSGPAQPRAQEEAPPGTAHAGKTTKADQGPQD